MSHTERCFSELGEVFRKALQGDSKDENARALAKEMSDAMLYNPWFIPAFVRLSFESWAKALNEENIRQWLARYSPVLTYGRRPLDIAIIMAGNIPMVGLHDLLCVVAYGHRAIVKTSSQDNRLIPAVIGILARLCPEMKDRIKVQEDILKGFDAVIATGSNNSSRYFQYYFGKYPNIIRRNRNSIAVITGNETDEELKGLACDILSYFGLGCRNVSKLYIPQGYDLGRLIGAMQDYAFLADHNKYRNNYDYQKSIFIINGIPHTDNGFLLFREYAQVISPVSVVHYEQYSDSGRLSMELAGMETSLQCIITAGEGLRNAIKPGKGQFPELWDYADGIDTMQFLTSL
jgi:hypothetical protein